MAKRLLDCFSRELLHYGRSELLESIKKCEGRVLACETIGTLQPMLGDITNAEFVSSMGADLVFLNMFDVKNPRINGLETDKPEETIHVLKNYIGRPVGINLEPVEEGEEGETGPMWQMTEGRRATLSNAKKACDMGVDMIILTGNPGMGVSNSAIEKTLRLYKDTLGERLILVAGKMHASGILEETTEKIISKDEIRRFKKAGADIILLPAPGTVPGITVEYVRELVTYAHSLGALTITAIGTSQEGADTATIRQLAIYAKMTGTDIHHLGDAGYGGMSLPENILAYSTAIRGIRHTYHRMAASINR